VYRQVNYSWTKGNLKNGIELAIVRNMQIKIIQKEVAELIDMQYKTVAFYANNKLIVPEFANPTGRGTTRIYSRNNLIEFLGVRELGKIKVINIKSRRKGKRELPIPEPLWTDFKFFMEKYPRNWRRFSY